VWGGKIIQKEGILLFWSLDVVWHYIWLCL